MKTAAFLRGELLREKEQFDRAVFDKGFTRDERLEKWQAFLVKVAPITQALMKAERYEARMGIRAARVTSGAGTVAAL
jgi:hypothetical protein